VSRPIVVHADWDPEAEVWVATTQDLRGLVTEAETVEALRAKLPGMILDLLEENGISDLGRNHRTVEQPAALLAGSGTSTSAMKSSPPVGVNRRRFFVPAGLARTGRGDHCA
jgi:predicted RNase H-like HicB family nuclease